MRPSSVGSAHSSTTSHHVTMNTVPLIKTSPLEIADSPPPFSDAGLPRTPSPSASPTLFLSSGAEHSVGSDLTEKNLKIPLKYQRHHHQKHYKKKFRERTWEEYDYEDSVSGGRNSNATVECDASTAHKSSKFRPKGKDWDWRGDYHHRNKNHHDGPDATQA